MKRIYLLLCFLFYFFTGHSQVLLSEGFEGGASFPPLNWTLINGNAPAGYDWTYNSDPTLYYVSQVGNAYPAHAGTGSMVYEFDPENSAKAWAITPAVSLTAGTSYTISFYYRVAVADYPEKLKVTLGSSATIAAQDSVLWNNAGDAELTNSNWALATIKHTPTTSGNFYFGFNCYSEPDQFTLMVDDIKIEVTPASVPGCTTNLSPVNNATGVENKPLTLSWNPATNASSYDLYVGTTNPPTSVLLNTTLTSASVTGAQYGTQYYYYVVPRNAAGAPTGCASSVTSFTIKNAPPPPPCATIIAPLSGASNVEANSLTFRWNAVPSATGYIFYFGDTNQPDSIGVVTDTTFGPFQFDFNSTYYWSVVPINDGGQAVGCALNSFTTRPSAPAPANDEVCNAISLNLNGAADCQNTEGATTAASDTLSCSSENNTVWYKYRPTAAGPVMIKMKRPSNSLLGLNAWIGIFTVSGECTSYVYNQTFDCLQADLSSSDSILIVTPPLDAETTYYIMLDGYSGAFGEYCISLLNPPAAPANDECTNAAVISAYVPVKATTLSATESMPAIECGLDNTGDANDDVWFSFTASRSGNATIDITPDGLFDPVVEVFTGDCNNLISMTCADIGADGDIETLQLADLVAGTTYYFRVYGYGSQGREGTFTITASGTALPVTLTNIRGERVGSENVLSWSTESEQNNRGFDLQRSIDGRTFTNLDFVASKAANGNSTATIKYQFTDARPFLGNTYYRLRQTDKDGRFLLSNIVMLKGAKINSFVLSNVYPNPAINKLNLVLTAPASDKVIFVVTDLAGKIIMQQTNNVISGDNNVSVNVSRLPSGSYLIKAICTNGCETVTSKFVKH